MNAVSAADIQLDLTPAPIVPSWVLKGTPMARNRTLFHSSDKSAWTILWDCTAGEFNWHYEFDETIHFLEGGAIIALPGGTPRRFGPGDVIFLPAGTVARWKVDDHVRKLAFCQAPVPLPLHWPLQLIRRIARLIRAAPALLQGK
jgi:uncharacterized cupin superfamily protein